MCNFYHRRLFVLYNAYCGNLVAEILWSIRYF